MDQRIDDFDERRHENDRSDSKNRETYRRKWKYLVNKPDNNGECQNPHSEDDARVSDKLQQKAQQRFKGRVNKEKTTQNIEEEKEQVQKESICVDPA
jgi:hypothetical protein